VASALCDVDSGFGDDCAVGCEGRGAVAVLIESCGEALCEEFGHVLGDDDGYAEVCTEFGEDFFEDGRAAGG